MTTSMATLSSVKTPLASNTNYIVLKDVKRQDDQGELLGQGAYGRVFEVQYAGKSCAAKEMHSIFFQISRPEELERLKRNFLRECSIWSGLHHPNIVTLIGVYFSDNDKTGMPIMVMEKMDYSLRALIDNAAIMDIDLSMKLSILHDVSGGLWHLHSLNSPIIHRDLTPNNILLRQGEAKISDLGVSKVMEDTAGGKMTKVPGTPDFMPPETFENNPKYGTEVDIFSYGGIILYTIVEEWPTPTAREKVNSENQKREIVSEIDRRQNYLTMMAKHHAGMLKPLVKSCLNDNPELRPTISEVSAEIKKIREDLNNYTGMESVPFTTPVIQHKSSGWPSLQVSLSYKFCFR